MRGTRERTSGAAGLVRIIPAHAGNSTRSPCLTCRTTDHPRACGELFSVAMNTGSVCGSSPRMRGTLQCVHGRPPQVRIIPAHAGNSPTRSCRADSGRDHPRACGELGNLTCSDNPHRGSSPRMRGTPVPTSPSSRVPRIIPAHAGNSPWPPPTGHQGADHPRACGELEPVPKSSVTLHGSSPRMRGTLQRAPFDVLRLRIIPAHAGNSLRV